MKLLGSYYTWSNNQDGPNRIFSKIDRVFVNEDWIDMFPNVNAIASWEVISDHCAIILKNISVIKNGLRPFRFFNMWTNHPLFKPSVLDSWEKELPLESYGLHQILRKLLRLQSILKRFNWKVVGDIVKEYENSKVSLQQAKNNLFSNPNNQSLSDIERISHLDYKQKEAAYASFLSQQSKVDWMRFGDENSSLFYSSMKKRKRLNRIVSFVDDQGSVVVDYPKEVQTAMFSIKSIKSPGPDGFGAGFYKNLWPNTGKEVASAVLEFFDLGHIPKRLNSTILALIPKVTQPSNASDYRPIACCNTLYKCISKMLCNRLIPILPK
ncbi:uncharacterized protein LOC133779556 [Humulus lupulus]|uniref:uncharacterized protein LOC133779556 n=1 Tax=Humulus lupulus TaxID=3486 RepID=UPI002B40652F|nr:uncharacterized protein LOC133779556 [Humulus lupulus]